MGVVGLGPDRNYYWLEVLRDRLSLTQRADLLFHLHDKWKPIEVRYEEYGMMADIEHIQYRQELENYRFDIVKVGGITPKNDRIKRLVPVFEQGKFYLPRTQMYTDVQGVSHDIVRDFVEEEYAAFPVAEHDDMLDMLARLLEPNLQLAWPRQREETSVEQVVEPISLDDRAQEWMAG
jgi:phage terminase large subunit-like protein